MKTEQFKKLIREMVREAVREELQESIRPMINEVLAGMLLEQVAQGGNAHKGRMLREASYSDATQLEEYPTMGQKRPTPDRGQMAALLGYGEYATGQARGGEITVTHAMTEAGTPVEIPPDAIPEHLKKALNKDYRSMLKAIDQKRGASGL